MKEEQLIILKSTDPVSIILNFVTEINKTENLTALVLPKLSDENYFQIKISKFS